MPLQKACRDIISFNCRTDTTRNEWNLAAVHEFGYIKYGKNSYCISIKIHFKTLQQLIWTKLNPVIFIFVSIFMILDSGFFFQLKIFSVYCSDLAIGKIQQFNRIHLCSNAQLFHMFKIFIHRHKWFGILSLTKKNHHCFSLCPLMFCQKKPEEKKQTHILKIHVCASMCICYTAWRTSVRVFCDVIELYRWWMW